ncbi:unnamed protein product [Dracunculus medinensis]|uniref:DUF1758 domain-containing protein n=1 Tax=Dracunculus medinensis TaxID=318479 RepID=A0A0N4U926_DRAME|nr:unnamed protein product [Dracunculus medinensis]
MEKTKVGSKKLQPIIKLPKLQHMKSDGSIRRSLDPGEKLRYLISCLEGEAKELVEEFRMDGESYKIAWEILESRYGDKSIINEELYKELRELSPKTKDIKDIQKRKCLTWNINELRNLMKAREEEELLSGRRIRSGDKKRLPKHKIINNFKEENSHDREQSERIKSTMVSSKLTVKRNIKKCIFYEKEHWGYQCKKIASYEEKLQLIRKLQRWFRCLKLGHRASDYYNRIKENSIVNEVFLPCREVFVINPLKPRKKIRALILLDMGSQQSYISETLRENVAPKIPQKYHTLIAEVGIILYDGSIFKIMANTVTQLTSQIKYMQLKAYQSSRTRGVIKMAKPDILIGSNYYFFLMRSGIKNEKKDSGGYVIDSRCYMANKECPSLVTFMVLAEQDLSQFWALETIGIAINLIDDEEAYEQFEKSVRRNEEGRCAISWPWKSPDP